MNSLTQGFKLCTAGNHTKNADWKLISQNKYQLPIFGSIIDMEHLEQLPTAEYILDKLNEADCFDFNYKPHHKDIIEWKHDQNTVYRFKYDYDHWVKAIKSTSIFGLAMAS